MGTRISSRFITDLVFEEECQEVRFKEVVGEQNELAWKPKTAQFDLLTRFQGVNTPFITITTTTRFNLENSLVNYNIGYQSMQQFS